MATAHRRSRLCSCLQARPWPGKAMCWSCDKKAAVLRGEPAAPQGFWDEPTMRKALASASLAEVFPAYRQHPLHGQNVSQADLARYLGCSQPYLSQIENDRRQITDLRKLTDWADRLGIPHHLRQHPTTSAGHDEHQNGSPLHRQAVLAIRAALGSYPLLRCESEEVAPLAQLMRQADQLDRAWTSSHFTVVTQNLPSLLRNAQNAVMVAPQEESVKAHRVLVTAYRLASSILLKFENNDIAWLAADRALNTALVVDDTWSLARATRSVARAMTSVNQQHEAISALLGMTDRMRSEVARNEKDLLSLFGMLHLAASITAAEQGDSSLALLMHQEALDAAERMQKSYDTHHTHFSTTNVAIHRVAALVRLRRVGDALSFAEAIPSEAIAVLPPERRANFLLDLTEANVQCGKYGASIESLLEIERVAPQEISCRPFAHGLLRLLLANTSGTSGRTVRKIAERAGVQR